MADIFTTYFTIDGESTSARFEYLAHAIELALALDDQGYEPVVADERRETLWHYEEDGESDDAE